MTAVISFPVVTIDLMVGERAVIAAQTSPPVVHTTMANPVQLAVRAVVGMPVAPLRLVDAAQLTIQTVMLTPIVTVASFTTPPLGTGNMVEVFDIPMVANVLYAADSGHAPS
jgi:hypothetical protein